MALGGGRTAKAGARYEAYAVANRIAQIILGGDPAGFIEVEPPPPTVIDDDGIECIYAISSSSGTRRMQSKRSSGSAQWSAASVIRELLDGMQKAIRMGEFYEIVTGATSSTMEQISRNAKQPLPQFKTLTINSNTTLHAQALREHLATAGQNPDDDATWLALARVMANVEWQTASEAVLRRELSLQLPAVHSLVGSRDSLEGIEARLLDAAARCDAPRATTDLTKELAFSSWPSGATPSIQAPPPSLTAARLQVLAGAMAGPDHEMPRLTARMLLAEALNNAGPVVGVEFDVESMTEADSWLVRIPGGNSPAQVALMVDRTGTAKLWGWLASDFVDFADFDVGDATMPALDVAAQRLLSWVHDVALKSP